MNRTLESFYVGSPIGRSLGSMVAVIGVSALLAVPLSLPFVATGLAMEEPHGNAAVQDQAIVVGPAIMERDTQLREIRRERARTISRLATRYAIGRARVVLIHDAALAERIDPDLAFRLVRVESAFRQRAIGPEGSVGLTQLQPSTARWLDSSVTHDRLFEAETNLRLGFRYLRMLIDRYHGDTRLALLAYNRGPGTVGVLLARGEDPANGYARLVLGSRGAGMASPVRADD